MSEAVLIYPHQLFADSPALKDNPSLPVYLIEEPLLLTHNPIHRQKLVFHKLSLDAYENVLVDQGRAVTRLQITEHKTSAAMLATIAKDGIGTIHVVDTTDQYLEKALGVSGLTRVWYDSPLFILTKEDAMKRFTDSKRFMANFYKALRKDTNILMDDDKPQGGKWSFDEDNRKKLPKKIELPDDLTFIDSDVVNKAIEWAASVPAEQYGEAGCWLPVTHADAQTCMATFFAERFADFGTYEDAISTRGTRLFHSTLSPLINVGLLTPQEVLDEAIAYAKQNDTPLNALEGFVRQILGWREFIRASYEVDGGHMRTQNFWQHTTALPAAMWDGTTDIAPVDHAVATALKYGYTHHIERLMVVGNYLLLTNIHPDDVYQWFMGMYVDAYDWVMVPNVYGMSQFSDGGSFATKPYISGANYIKKMSDHESGQWEETWTALYWNFISTHKEVFANNHRLAMMPRLLEKMDPEKRNGHVACAKSHLNSVS